MFSNFKQEEMAGPTSNLQNQLDNLISVVQQVAISKNQQSRQCGVCFMMDHPTNWSLYFRDDNFGQAYDLGECQGHQGFQDQ